MTESGLTLGQDSLPARSGLGGSQDREANRDNLSSRVVQVDWLQAALAILLLLFLLRSRFVLFILVEVEVVLELFSPRLVIARVEQLFVIL